MINERVLALNVRQLKVAFEVALKAYEEVGRNGVAEEPQLAAAALAEIRDMVSSLSAAGLDRMGFSGFHVNELLRRGGVLPHGGETA